MTIFVEGDVNARSGATSDASGTLSSPIGNVPPFPGPRILLSRSIEGEAICHLQDANQMCFPALWPLHHLSASCEGTVTRILPAGLLTQQEAWSRPRLASNSFMLDSFESSRQKLGLVTSTSLVLCIGCLRLMTFGFSGVVVGLGTHGLPTRCRAYAPWLLICIFFSFFLASGSYKL